MIMRPAHVCKFVLFGCLLLHCPAAAAPRLIVLLVGDQVRADYLERFHDDMGPAGLRRFRDEGTYYLQARQDHAVKKTSPGHVLIGPGLYASDSGIISNEWYDRASSRTVIPTELIPNQLHTSLVWFKGSSLGFRLHETRPKSRIVGVSLKDRAALLLGGPDQDEAYWFDLKTKEWVSYHGSSDMLQQFNRDQKGPTKTTLELESMADQPTEELAERVLRQWKLGHNPSKDPDILTVSFSAVDLVGHRFGPDSPEVKAAFLQLDRMISKLMRTVEHVVGKNVVYAFSSDHGVTPLPELSKARGLDVYRVNLRLASVPDKNLILAVSDPWIYINENEAGNQGLTMAQAQERLREIFLRLPGVAAVYTSREIAESKNPQLRHSYYPGRCGDLWLVLNPGSIFSAGNTGTTHGQPTDDDQRVPLGFYGPGFRAQVRTEQASVAIISSILLDRLAH